MFQRAQTPPPLLLHPAGRAHPGHVPPAHHLRAQGPVDEVQRRLHTEDVPEPADQAQEIKRPGDCGRFIIGASDEFAGGDGHVLGVRGQREVGCVQEARSAPAVLRICRNNQQRPIFQSMLGQVYLGGSESQTN